MAFSKIILNNQTLMDVTTDTVEASKLLSGETATAASGQKVTGTLTINDFVITLTQNQISGNLEPDCTFAEAVAAYNAGKNIVFVSSEYPVIGGYDSDRNLFWYAIAAIGEDEYGTSTITPGTFEWTSNDITYNEAGLYYNVNSSMASAQPSDVLSGETFFNTNGYQTGTIQLKTSTNVSVFGATVYVPSGYYTEDVQKTVATATHANPTASINSSTGLVTASHTQTAGYVSAGTTTGTLQLTTQAAATITPTTATQTAVAAGLYTLGAVIVEPIPSAYIIPSGTLSITSNSTYDVTQYASVEVAVQGGREDEEWYKVSGLYNLSFSISLSSMRVGAFAQTSICAVNGDNLSRVPMYAFYMCRMLSDISFQSATQIDSHAFTGCTSLTQISFPAVTYVQTAAFSNCTSLTEANIPNLTTIGSEAFYNCRTLSFIDTTNLTRIEGIAFYNCLSFIEFNAPKVSYLGNTAFWNCTNLTTVSFPLVTLIGSAPFSSCSQLSYIYFPALKSVPIGAFAKLSNLQTIDLTSASILGNYCFSSCSRLSSVIAPNVTSIQASAFAGTAIESYVGRYTANIGVQAFANCTHLSLVLFSRSTGTAGLQTSTFANCQNLISLYLLGFNRFALANLNAFASTPIYDYSDVAGRWGSIFVPASLYDSYITATNWATLSDRFVSLTDAEIEELLAE